MDHIKITFPNGDSKSFAKGISISEIAESISISLKKKAIAGKIDDKLMVDLSHQIHQDSSIEIITIDSDEGLEIIRHDTAHILAQAVKELYPDVLVTIGPVIENGFYYDFYREAPFHLDDLPKIEEKMTQIVAKNIPITRKVFSKKDAIQYFQSLGETYKVELIEAIPEGEEIGVYFQGDFADLCRGPHSPSTGTSKAFKLTKVSGSYWRGDSKNQSLQRIYGTAWRNPKELETYLHLLEEAEKRDHRKLGKAMSLFHFQEEGPGAVFWHPKGWAIFQELLKYMRRKCEDNGYVEVSTPELLDSSIWVTSGHAEKFSENMFFSTNPTDDRVFAIKPMNCPGGLQIFNADMISYTDLPIRMAEFGKVHRYEPSGSLHGLMRVRAFTQDDAHIFCTDSQIMEECVYMCNLILAIYKDFSFENIKLKLSTRPEKRIGSDEIWDKSEAALQSALDSIGIPYSINPGEGAFYGPKIEFAIKDAIGRDWQMGTIQVDFNLPERFNAYYTGEDGKKHHPVMIHRAIFGSLERFIGVLLEHTSGHLPLWLAPIQVAVLSISEDSAEYAQHVCASLKKRGIKAIADNSNATVNYKIRLHSLQKVPYIAVVGKNEKAANTVSIRKLGGNSQEVLALQTFIDKMFLETVTPQ